MLALQNPQEDLIVCTDESTRSRQLSTTRPHEVRFRGLLTEVGNQWLEIAKFREEEDIQ